MLYREPYEQQFSLLSTDLNGIFLPSIIGLAAGYDGTGKACQGLFDLGFGHVEIGSLSESMIFPEQDS